LEPFGLSGAVPDAVQRDVFELNQVRNCLLHRAGRADRRLIDACPWLGLTTGMPVVVTHQTYQRYVVSLIRYATQLVVRITEHSGVEMKEIKGKPAGSCDVILAEKTEPGGDRKGEEGPSPPAQ